MSEPTISTGNVCVNEIASRKLKRDILPNHGEYYRGAREQKDRQRFITFVQSQAATILHEGLNHLSHSSNSLKENPTQPMGD